MFLHWALAYILEFSETKPSSNFLMSSASTIDATWQDFGDANSTIEHYLNLVTDSIRHRAVDRFQHPQAPGNGLATVKNSKRNVATKYSNRTGKNSCRFWQRS